MVVINENPLYYAAIGGIILGIATSINYCFRGRVTGMSGVIFDIVTCNTDQLSQKITIAGGMLLASGIFFDIFGYGTHNNFTPFGPADQIANTTSYIGYGLAGFLVGFGTRFSNGCTSGHGLCGLARMSIRSIVAVAIFLATAISISTLRYYVTLGPFSDATYSPTFNYDHRYSANICIALGALLPITGMVLKIRSDSNKMSNCSVILDYLIVFAVGLIFGLGLLVSGMVRRSNVLGFLQMGAEWNPSLLFVLGCGVLVNLITFQYMIRIKKKSILGRQLFNPDFKVIDCKLILGAACFGWGWGIGGICPGPAIMQFSIFTLPIHIIWFSFTIIGMHVSKIVESHLNEIKKKQQQPIQIQVAPPRKVSQLPPLQLNKQTSFDELHVDNITKDTRINVSSESMRPVDVHPQQDDQINSKPKPLRPYYVHPPSSRISTEEPNQSTAPIQT